MALRAAFTSAPRSDVALGSAFGSVAVPARTVFAHPVLFTPAVLLPVELVAGAGAVPAALRRCRRRAVRRHRQICSASAGATAAPLLLTAVLVVMAVLVAPERPADQEAICQRHNGVAACRVW
ncbi:hypothetical protein NZK33_03595 [Cyanobium sp. FGCU-6]|jgi:hypothetical protein|nr:hypothetical protein [Cyanobium sp. FGCU6]